MSWGGPCDRDARTHVRDNCIARLIPHRRDRLILFNLRLLAMRLTSLTNPAFTAASSQFLPGALLTLCAKCSISPALRTTVTESVSGVVLSTSVFSSVAIFSRSAHCLATSGSFGSAAVSPGCCAAGAEAAAFAGVLAPGGLIAGSGKESCAWVRVNPTLAATDSPARHPTKQSHCARLFAR